MEAVHLTDPAVSVRNLRIRLILSRSWWRPHAHMREPDRMTIALRDAIERIVLAFQGHGYRGGHNQIP